MGTCCQTSSTNDFEDENSLLRSKKNILNAVDEPTVRQTVIESDLLEGIPDDAIHIRLNASYDEKQYPIWVDYRSRLKFYVKGTWSLYDGDKIVSCRGDEQNPERILGYPVGCLMGYIQGGEAFHISDRLAIEANSSGSLFLFQNNGQYETKPSGYLDIFILGGKIYKYPEIEKLAGWNYNVIDTTKDANYMSQGERELIILINKLRYNPKMFADKYLTHLRGLSRAHDECYDLLYNLPQTNLQMLQCNRKLYSVAGLHAKDMGENGEVGHISTDQRDLSERIRDIGLITQSFGENCSYGKAAPISIMLQLIVDDENDNSGHRENFLKEEFSHIGVSIYPHNLYEWNCVQTFAALEEND